jgi:hypothetical protein
VVFDPVAIHVYCAPLCMSGSLIPKSGHLQFVAHGECRRNSSLQHHPRHSIILALRATDSVRYP